MIRHTTLSLALAAATVIATPACKKTQQDLTAYKDQALGAVIQYGPQLTELGGRFTNLVARVKALPENLPGRADLQAMLDAQKANLSKLQASLSSYADAVGTAVKNGSRSEIEKVSRDLVAQFQASLGDLGAALKDLDARVEKLESAAKALAPAADAATAPADAIAK